MDRRGLLRLLGLAPIAAIGQAVGMPAAARPELGHLSGTLSALEPMEIGFVRDTMPTVFVHDELHEVTDLVVSQAAAMRDRFGAEAFCAVDPAGTSDVRITMTFGMGDGIAVAGDVRQIELKPGDRFVFTTDQRLSAEQVRWIQEKWRRFWAEGAAPEILVIDGAELTLVRCADGDNTEARSAGGRV